MTASQFIACWALGILVAGTAQAQSIAVSPGQWEFTSESGSTFVRGDQTMSGPTQTETSTMCLPKEDATFTPAKLAREGCTTSNASAGERRLSFLMTCSQGGVTVDGVLVFSLSEDRNSGNSFVSMSGEAGGGGFLATVTTDAKRVGDC